MKPLENFRSENAFAFRLAIDLQILIVAGKLMALLFR